MITDPNQLRLYWQAVGFMVLGGIASTSLIQRKLDLPYKEASVMIDQAVLDGILSEPDLIGKRDVLIKAPIAQQ